MTPMDPQDLQLTASLPHPRGEKPLDQALQEALVEEYIEGREIYVGVLGQIHRCIDTPGLERA